MDKLTFSGIPSDSNSCKIISPKIQAAADSFYFTSNDQINLKRTHFNKSQTVVMGIANVQFLHLIAVFLLKKVPVSEIYAIDSSFKQLIHFHRLLTTVKLSPNRIVFLQNFYHIKCNAFAIKILNDITPKNLFQISGGHKHTKDSLEKHFWMNVRFDETAFAQKHEIKTQKTNSGILIRTKTAGDIDQYYSTIIAGGIGSDSIWSFPIGFGEGFLRDDKTYENTRIALENIPTTFIQEDISSAFPPLLAANKYYSLVLWTSNVFDEYFLRKSSSLCALQNKLLSIQQARDKQFEIDMQLVQDSRLSRRNLYKKRKLSIHATTFKALVPFIIGDNNIEVVNQTQWIDEDNGISKLYCTQYRTVQQFSQDKNNYSTIIFHILVGHGMNKRIFFNLVKKAIIQSQRVIILEHNIHSNDFKKNRIGLSIEEIRNNLGMECHLHFAAGFKSRNRNFIAVYNGRS